MKQKHLLTTSVRELVHKKKGNTSGEEDEQRVELQVHDGGRDNPARPS